MTAQAGKQGLRGGWALDVMHTCAVTGRKWDCLKKADRDWCKRMLTGKNPSY